MALWFVSVLNHNPRGRGRAGSSPDISRNPRALAGLLTAHGFFFRRPYSLIRHSIRKNRVRSTFGAIITRIHEISGLVTLPPRWFRVLGSREESHMKELFNFDNFAFTFVIGLIIFSWLMFLSVVFFG
jgi:hypothetical protein